MKNQIGDDDRLYPDTYGKCSDCEYLQKCPVGGLYCELGGHNIDEAEEETCDAHKSIRRIW